MINAPISYRFGSAAEGKDISIRRGNAYIADFYSIPA